MSFKSGHLERWLQDSVLFQSLFKNIEHGLTTEGSWMEGDFFVNLITGREIGPFRLRIVFPEDYYLGLSSPSTYLMSHRHWRNHGDAHIELSWKLCLFLKFESLINFENYDSFRLYLEKLANYMVDQWFYQEDVIKYGPQNAKWVSKARGHNIDGTIEAVASSVESFSQTCPCNSGKSYNECHHRYVQYQFQEYMDARRPKRYNSKNSFPSSNRL